MFPKLRITKDKRHFFLNSILKMIVGNECRLSGWQQVSQVKAMWRRNMSYTKSLQIKNYRMTLKALEKKRKSNEQYTAIEVCRLKNIQKSDSKVSGRKKDWRIHICQKKSSKSKIPRNWEAFRKKILKWYVPRWC